MRNFFSEKTWKFSTLRPWTQNFTMNFETYRFLVTNGKKFNLEKIIASQIRSYFRFLPAGSIQNKIKMPLLNSERKELLRSGEISSDG